jgi:cardiolipin synthase
MEWLEEGCLIVDDRSFAKAFEQRWLVDMARSRQVTARRPAGDGEELREDAAGVRTAQSSVSP